MSKSHNCAKCDALCCIAWGASIGAIDSDLEKWDKYDADHISQYVADDKRLWMDPKTGERLNICPFLTMINEKHACSIYPKENEPDLRPTICNSYPMNKKCLQELTADTHYSKDGYELNMACFVQKNQK